ncbi:MAG: hypothetical protein NTV46_06460, partial [Verrucomicrobia bacterium]|nr:hypothetical protein [Verrucomicrobiota bacterium]
MDRESPDSPANTPQYPATFVALLVDGESIRIFVSQWLMRPHQPLANKTMTACRPRKRRSVEQAGFPEMVGRG